MTRLIMKNMGNERSSLIEGSDIGNAPKSRRLAKNHSCPDDGRSDKLSLRDYQIDFNCLDVKSSVKILFLTDIHWEYAEDIVKKTAFLNALIKNSNPDFVMLGGDQVASASNKNYESLFKVLEGFSEVLGRDLYYGLVWGNHDEQWHWDDLSSSRLKESNPHCLYLEVDDMLVGESNYVINLKKNGKTLWQIYALDSNSMALYPSEPHEGYDTIHDDQVEWFKEEVLESQKRNPGVKNIVYFHIPLWETEYAYRLSVGDKLTDYASSVGYLGRFSGVMHEERTPRGELGMTNTCTSNVRSSFFSCAESLGATIAMFYGHDHIDDFAAQYKLDEKDDYIWLVYGLKSGEGIYHDPALLGGTMMEIRDDMTYSIYRCFQSYEDDYREKKGYREETICQ